MNDREKEIVQQYKSDYIINKEPVLKAFEGGLRKMLELCACSGIPVIAAYGYIYEETQDEQYKDKLIELIEFYRK